MITAAVMLSLTTALKIENWYTPGGVTSAQSATSSTNFLIKWRDLPWPWNHPSGLVWKGKWFVLMRCKLWTKFLIQSQNDCDIKTLLMYLEDDHSVSTSLGREIFRWLMIKEWRLTGTQLQYKRWLGVQQRRKFVKKYKSKLLINH